MISIRLPFIQDPLFKPLVIQVNKANIHHNITRIRINNLITHQEGNILLNKARAIIPIPINLQMLLMVIRQMSKSILFYNG